VSCVGVEKMRALESQYTPRPASVPSPVSRNQNGKKCHSPFDRHFRISLHPTGNTCLQPSLVTPDSRFPREPVISCPFHRRPTVTHTHFLPHQCATSTHHHHFHPPPGLPRPQPFRFPHTARNRRTLPLHPRLSPYFHSQSRQSHLRSSPDFIPHCRSTTFSTRPLSLQSGTLRNCPHTPRQPYFVVPFFISPAASSHRKRPTRQFPTPAVQRIFALRSNLSTATFFISQRLLQPMESAFPHDCDFDPRNPRRHPAQMYAAPSSLRE
jgi:hypothetical protein